MDAPLATACRPHRVTRLDLPEYAHNASIFRQGERLRLCWRQGVLGSRLYLGDLNADLQAENARPLAVEDPRCICGQEDPRVVAMKNRLFVGFVGIHHRPGGVRQMLGMLDSAGCRLEALAPQYAQAMPIEKNWGWFEHEGQIYCLYTIRAQRILRLVGDELQPFSQFWWKPRWTGGWLRGGAAPMRVGSEYWCFFHGVWRARPFRREFRHYNLSCYAFAAEPPFRPVRYLPKPLLWPPAAGRPETLRSAVVFPCGAVRRGEDWLISYGVHDSWVEIAEFSHAEIDAAMVKVR